MKSFRIIRINELLKRVVSEFLHQRFSAETVNITITRVKVTDDLKKADVYFTVFHLEDRKSAFQFLKKIRNVTQYGVSKQVRLKHTPRLFFVWDVALEKTHQTFELLRKIDIELPPTTDEQFEGIKNREPSLPSISGEIPRKDAILKSI